MARILIAEDDASMRHFLSAALERAGHSVLACPDGLAALDALKASDEAYDLLLADIIMPGIDGIELSQKATWLYPTLKVMFITGFAAVALNQVEGQPEVDKASLMAKPFHLRDLVDKVDLLLSA